MSSAKFRLVTRSDFDGLVCAVLLKHLDLIEDIKFVHPKDMQDGLVAIGPNDITTNLPYVDGVYQAFDHHLSETLRVGPEANHIIDPDAPSAAHVVCKHFGGRSRFPANWKAMLDAVDRGDSAQYRVDDILEPKDWTLLNFIMDARTGLGRFRDFRVSNYELMMNLIDYCTRHSIDEILALPDVRERTDLYFAHQERFEEQITRCATVRNNLVVLDLRDEETIYAGNRFVIYALFPACNISIHVMWGVKKANTVFAIGKSIVNRTSNTNIGALCLQYGGGGHANAGTCQVANERAAEVLADLIARITADG
ncbi:exopolyphosphatase [Telmatospirillum siberiense]|uniref:Exopolyphosphatase n=1 Tax=Telmatospirillum siberiense TaxID=382514 RepID=A0A2N3Q191_9PROT|nr:exopolyphosphatase [Telmatospirillum siberiense]PKU26361.1 exopolyphosphatase [Telmatospirillum siberiense]